MKRSEARILKMNEALKELRFRCLSKGCQAYPWQCWCNELAIKLALVKKRKRRVKSSKKKRVERD